MSTNHTPNYALSLWEAADQVIRTDFNADNLKIDAALAGKLNKFELIRKAPITDYVKYLSFDLSDINWNEWSLVGFFYDSRKLENPIGTFYFTPENADGNLMTYCSASSSNFAYNNSLPFMVVFLPLNDSSRQVRSLNFTNPGGIGIARCTFDELVSVKLSYSGNNYLDKGSELVIWGMR